MRVGARLRAAERGEGDGFRRGRGRGRRIRARKLRPREVPRQPGAGRAAERGEGDGFRRGRGRGRRIRPRKLRPWEVSWQLGMGRAADGAEGDASRHEMHRGRNRTPREAARENAAPPFPGGAPSFARFRGSWSAGVSPSGGFAALCVPVCRRRCQGRRISPREGPKETDSAPKVSPLQGLVALAAR